MTLLLITYDIASDTGRTKLAKQLEQYGFTRIQLSVFAGTATDAQWKKWQPVIQKTFLRYQEQEDKLYIIPQSPQLFRQIQQTGAPLDIDWVTGKTQVLYY